MPAIYTITTLLEANRLISILYADADTAGLKNAKSFLEETGRFRVDTQSSVAGALEAFRPDVHEAVVSGHRLPGLDGILLLKSLRAKGEMIPFILFTAEENCEVAIEALNAGADFFVRKKGETEQQFVQLADAVERVILIRREEKVCADDGIRFHALVENSSDIIRILDRDGRIVFDAGAFGGSLGYPKGFSIGKSPFEFIHPGDIDRVKKDLADVYANMRDGRPTEFRIRKPDGTYIWVESIGKNLVGVPGIDGIVITTRIIEDRKRAEEKLQKSEARYRRLYDSMTDAFAAADLEGRFTEWNPAFREISGYTDPELRRMSLPDILPEHLREQAKKDMEEILDIGFSEVIEWEFRKKDGSVIPIELRIFVLRDEDGKPNGTWAIVRDISERRRAAEKISLVNRKLALMSDVTYQDIQNKVTALRGYVDLSRGKASESERAFFFEMEEKILEAIHHLITNTKDYQQMGVNQIRWIPLEKAIREQIDLVSTAGEISFGIELDGLEINSDPLLGRVFFNLIDNAVRHGKTLTRVSFRFRETQDGAIVTCEDNGIGIPPEQKPHIFDRVVGGEGHFGLFFTKEFLGLSGMSITETGIPGKGARFEISVPKGLYRFARA